MRQLFVALILSSLSYTIAQAKELPSDTIVRYYDLTNKAELSVCDGQTANAIKYYDTAYQIMGKKMSFRQLYNYFITSIEIEDYLKAKPLLCALIKMGWKENNYSSLMKSYYNSTKLSTLMRLYRDSKCSSNLDSKYIGKIDSLVWVDRNVNQYYRSKINGLLDSVGLDTFYKVTANNMAQLKTLFSNDFPTDLKIGREDGPVFRNRYDVILRHNLQIASEKKIGMNHSLDSILYKAVLKGDLDPIEFEAYISSPIVSIGWDSIRHFGEISIVAPLCPYDFAKIHDSLFEFKIPQERIEYFNFKRRLIPWLVKSEDFKRKLVFQYYNRRYNFIPIEDYVTDLNNEDLPKSVLAKFIHVPNQ